MRRNVRSLVLFSMIALSARAQEPLDWVEKLGDVPLTLRTPHRWITVAYTGTLELEGYIIDTRAPGLIFDNDSFFNFRNRNMVTLSVGEHISIFVEERNDRRFDPSDRPVRAGFEQYFIRWTPFDQPWINLQAGKFPTPVGNFVPRHDAFDRALIRDPLPYDFMTGVSDATVVPGVTAVLNRRNLPDNKAGWVPMIWGPVYHTGAEVFGTAGQLDYAFALTDAPLSARPGQWDLDCDTDDKWNYSGRIGFSPLIGLKLGASYAIGPYLTRTPATAPFKNNQQETFGFDAAYSFGHWQFWSEFFATSWEVPNISEELRAYSYYIEGRYKFTPGFYGSLRWGQIFFNEIADAGGNPTRWDRDAWRVECGIGYFFARNLVGKLQYEHNHQNGRLQQGANMVTLQLALRWQ